MKNLTFLILSIISTVLHSQHECGFDHIRMMGLMDESSDNLTTTINDRGGIVTIPVVFHVVHLGEEIGVGTNISDEQILDGLRIINEDLRKIPNSWGDGNGVDVEIELCLAQRDPNGNPTTGIDRINGTQWSEYITSGVAYYNNDIGLSDNTLKNSTTWNRSNYLNVWIVSEISGNNGLNGTQAYATLPTFWYTDGIVILHNVIGSIGNVKVSHNMSRTFTHEFGHYMGLYHTFEDYGICPTQPEIDCTNEGDYVCDTPPTKMNFACSPVCPNSQYQNYMDYTSQGCRNMFSSGQKARMRGPNGLLHPARVTLLESMSCTPLNYANSTILNPTYFMNCGTPSMIPQVEIRNTGNLPIYDVDVKCEISNSGYSVIYPWSSTDPLENGESVILTFPSTSNEFGYGTMSFEILTEDGFSNDNFFEIDYESLLSEELTLLFDPDVFGYDISWELVDDQGEVIWFGGDYPNGSNQVFINVECVPSGCYTFTVYDQYGDGLMLGGGFFDLSDGLGNTLAYGSGNYGYEISFEFCIDPIIGILCEDLNTNWVCDNDEINFIVGCMDSNACNFNPDSNINSNECVYPGEIYNCNGGCMVDIDSDGICDQLEVYGCTDMESCNYNFLATQNEGCVYPESGYSCGGIPLSSLNTITGIEELQEFHLIKEIRIFDATGRDLDPSIELSAGIYLIQIRFLNGELENHKVFLN